MALNVISNFAANVAHRNLVKSDMDATASLAKLSSGSRIVSAKDDAASLAIGSRIAAEVGALRQTVVNAGQAGSMLQIADGAMSRANDILTRMKALAVQAASGHLSDVERGMLNTEYDALRNEISRIGNDTEFNSVKMLAGSQGVTLEVSNSHSFQGSNGFDAVRANSIPVTAPANSSALDLSMGTNAAGVTFAATDSSAITYSATLSSNAFSNGTDTLLVPQSITLTSTNAQNSGTVVLDLNTALVASQALNASGNNSTVSGSSNTTFTFKVGTGSIATEDDLTFSFQSLVAIGDSLATGIGTQTTAETASGEVSTAIDALNSARALVGANQSRLDFAAANLATAIENSEAARSTLLDLDVAAEMTTFTSKQVLLQAGVSMLAQANQMPQNLLALFQ